MLWSPDYAVQRPWLGRVYEAPQLSALDFNHAYLARLLRYLREYPDLATAANLFPQTCKRFTYQI